ncbi:sodium:solute symporter family protein [Cardinium endosymbiont of Oedothorax gibbosus]|uniref:sodium:solute symporter family protein n=1 Tax=Cardinium endosymbiont of Oedothorax gibbosus TaxID=931101 RepID=UPI0020253767|nr:sodium:solute symporter family protein [Cardinium endosymbiont of Oedothorax gibbosus]CAH2560173.1 Sodium:solute symporter family protein [Cardinium endosymbiont of Oedothorax gibbosus]
MALAFLGLTLVAGLYVNQKATTFREYAVGNKRFRTTTLVVTALATVFGGGSLMREMPNIYSLGLHHIVTLLMIPVGFWTVSLLGLRMGPFMGHLSVAETIGSVYGKYPRAIAALLGICFSIGVVAIQISVMSSAIGMCIDSIDPRIVTVLATLILITYAMLGGVRAITVTDILQFATFTVIIPLVIKFVFVKTGKSFLEVILLLKKQEKFQFGTLFQFDKKLLKLVLWVLLTPFLLSPVLLQRVYMASGPIQARKVLLRVTLFRVIIVGYIISIGLLVFVWDPTLSVTEIWPYILAAMSPPYKGCVVIGLLGMTMSTADSNLHTAAVMASHDVVESIRGVKAGSCMYQIRLAKLTALVLGLLAMIVTVYYPDLFELTKFAWTYLTSFFMVAVIPPFILAILGFRGSAYTALIGMTVGILVYLVFEKWGTPAIDIGDIEIIPYIEIIPLAANALAMIAAHYLLPQPDGKGWIGSSDQQRRMEQLIRAFKKYKKLIDLE